ncbi:MAG TPA: sugar transferase [Longimicrobiaceae bacterium]|jgi:exopolysaccharide biosynthesis polyprenyl glycosylphosphotransferase|nr:sugar transferase [Longimicrobiaceae bacterium]
MLHSQTSSFYAYETADAPAASAASVRMPPYDVRLRREITHRRLAVSLARRSMRVLALHVLDSAVLAAVLYALSAAWQPPVPAQPFVPAVVAIFLLSLNALSAYDSGDARRDRKRLASGVLLAVLIVACLAVFPPYVPFPREFVAALAVAAFASLAVGRKVVDLAVRQAYVRGIGLRRAVVIGSLDEVGRAIREMRDDRNIDQYVVGHLTQDDRPDPASLGTLSRLTRVLDEMNIQELVLATALSSETMSELAVACFDRGVAVYVLPSVVGNPDCWAEPLRLGDCPMLRLHPARLQLPALMIKRGVDVVLATVALVALSPVIALIALAILVDSPGPVFFRQERVGLGGRIFLIWKFRSMTADAHERQGELAHLNIYGNRGAFKLRDDPRVTRMGRFLRRTSLDELPQLFNILSGEMSLVGPRPCPPGDVDTYEPHHFDRLTVVPGLTGPWQVSGRNLITDFDTIVQMERAYITGWSLLLDLQIMLRTVKVVLRGEGAY